MRKLAILAILALVMTPFWFSGVAKAETTYVTMYYGDISLDGNFYWMPGTWNLNVGEVTVRYTLDLSKAPNVKYTDDYGMSGYVGLVNPSSFSGAWMSGFLADPDKAGEEFPTYPDDDNNLDLDDKFNMQRFPNPDSWDEKMYDVYCETCEVADFPFGSGDNYGIWFDRDGVNTSQADMWGMVDGGTYNTGGVYDVRIVYRKHSETKGTACATFFPDLQNEDAPGGYGVPTGFYSSGWDPEGPDIIPAGLSWDTDEMQMDELQVFVNGRPGNGAIEVRDLTVTGYMNLEEGMATGGGWFIPEDSLVGLTEGGKATFGFVAKQDDKKGSTGQLEFQYHDDNLNLKSTSYYWVNVAATQAMFEGEGTINGDDGYKFRVRAVDGDKLGTGTDRFEIRIWTNGGSFDSPTYRAEGDLQGGQIVVHKK